MNVRRVGRCPCPASIAPYVHEVLRVAGQEANSIYRGLDPAALPILRANGLHTQAELYATLPAGVANPPGRSTHELKSDGVAYPGIPIGGDLEEWQQGTDSGQNTVHDRDRIEAAARELGWSVFHPYAAGVELHHWNFRRRPRPRGVRQRARIIRLRATLPRK